MLFLSKLTIYEALGVKPPMCIEPSVPLHVVGLKNVSVLIDGGVGSTNVNVPAGTDTQPLGAVTVRLL